MTSQPRIIANRRNARRSTGPRTAASKGRASRNATRHRLSVSVLNDPQIAIQVEALAAVVAGASPSETRLEHARAFAEAEFELRRVRCIRTALMNFVPVKPVPQGSPPAAENLAAVPDRVAVLKNLPEVLRLERYECRAMSRRRKALRALASSSKSEAV
jgi:hypothetical protein